MIGFFAYLGCAILFFALACYACFSKQPVGIWANQKGRPNVSDVSGYNRAAAKLFAACGVVMALCGLPMLLDEHVAVVLLVSVVGMMLVTVVMIAAVVKIDQKYKVKYQ